MDTFLAILGGVLLFMGAIVGLLFVLSVYLLIGWLLALGFLAYGQPIAAFWAFVAWLGLWSLFKATVS